MATGTVKWFSPVKGYGFITPDEGDKDLFVHFSEVVAAGMESLTEGQRISFDVVTATRGLKAANLAPAEQACAALDRRRPEPQRSTGTGEHHW